MVYGNARDSGVALDERKQKAVVGVLVFFFRPSAIHWKYSRRCGDRMALGAPVRNAIQRIPSKNSRQMLMGLEPPARFPCQSMQECSSLLRRKVVRNRPRRAG
jgi:hypothetical protein